MTIDIARIRNVGFVGHGGVGKTSLVDAILFHTGMITRLGRVEDGTATTDFDPEEVKRHISVNLGVAHADYRDHRINLVDMPGFGDFAAEARSGLRVVEAAIVVVDAVAGVEVQTERTSKLAAEYGLPRIVVVNRMDRERADLERVLESVRRRLKGRFVELQVPIGQEAGFRGVVDVVRMKAHLAGSTPGQGQDTDVPAEMVDAAREARDRLVEAVAETDDDLLARYLEEGTLPDEEVSRALRAAIANGKLVPVVCAAGARVLGVRPLLDLIVDAVPSPAERPAVSGVDPRSSEPVSRGPSVKEPFGALVFKTLTDPHVGKVTLFRVFSGVLTGNSQVYNASRDARERVGQLAWVQGKDHRNVEALGAGEIGMVLKLKETLTGDTLCPETAPFRLPPIGFPEPSISFALAPKTKGDEDKISNALARLAEEDPTLRYHYDPETKQLLISGVGQLHIEVTLERMKRKFHAEVNLLPPRIPYKETVRGRAEVQGRHKKQTGGRGQFGDCWVRIEPLSRGGGFEFVDEIFGGSIPRNFIPSVEKGVRARLERGVVAGYPVVDVKVTLYDGSYHSVDSSDIAFQLAGQLAAEKAVLEARPCLLEPIMTAEVIVPSSLAGDIIGDLNSRRGKIAGMEPGDESTTVRAQVPMAEMLNFEPHLRSMSGGRGSYSMEFSHYEELPGALAEKVVAEARKEREARAAEKH